MLKPLYIAAFICVVGLSAARGDITTVSFDSGSHTLLNNLSTVLSGGTSADGNGDVLQLGYFTGANFTGTFVPLSGQGSLNTAVIPGSNPAGETYNQTSIGDLNVNGAGDGQYALSLDFTLGSSTSGNNLPASGTQLAIRFYNNTTIGSSTFFNTVTDPLWLWQTPAVPPSTVNMSLDDAGLLWQSIVAQGQDATTAFHTSIATAVPEPSSAILLALGAAMAPVALRLRRKK